MVNLERYKEFFNTFGDLSGRSCVPNRTENVNISVFNMITKINESKKK